MHRIVIGTGGKKVFPVTSQNQVIRIVPDRNCIQTGKIFRIN